MKRTDGAPLRSVSVYLFNATGAYGKRDLHSGRLETTDETCRRISSVLDPRPLLALAREERQIRPCMGPSESCRYIPKLKGTGFGWSDISGVSHARRRDDKKSPARSVNKPGDVITGSSVSDWDDCSHNHEGFGG